jgi:RNA polymerase sigma factor FliA
MGDDRRASPRNVDISLGVAAELLSAPARASERTDLAIEITLTSENNLFVGVTENLSEGGVFVACQDILPIGTTVEIRLSLPDGEPIRTKATVRWSRPLSAPEGPGMGLQFGALTSEDAVRVHRFAAERPPMYWDPGDEGGGGASEAPPPGLPRDVALRFVPVIRALAHRLARRLPPHILVDDLVGVGFVGLVEAYRHYAAAHSDRFATFAHVRIRGAMLDELRSLDPLTRRLRRFARKLHNEVARLEGLLGRSPEDFEIAEALGMAVDTLRHSRDLIGTPHVTNLDCTADLADPSADAPDDVAAKAEALSRVATAMDGLPPRLREVLELYYGEQLSLRDVGSVLGVTEARVCQLHKAAIERLRSGAR